jgi:hypothetical protein
LGGAVVALDLNGDALRAALKPLPADRVMTVVGSVVDADLANSTVEETSRGEQRDSSSRETGTTLRHLV